MRPLANPVRYSYALLSICIAGGLAVGLGFALVSGIRHLLWMNMMQGDHKSFLLWLETTGAAFLTLLFWYRILAAVIRQRRRVTQLEKKLQSRLHPFTLPIPASIRDLASWYLVDDDQPMAFTWGVWRPRIALSTGLCKQLDEEAQEAVMFHEAAHARMRDPLQQTILVVLSEALGPLGMHALYKRYLIGREIWADQEALRACGGDDIPLLSALVAVGRDKGTQDSVASYVGLAGVLEARVEFLETGSLPQLWDGDIRYRLMASFMAVVFTVGEGLLVWCH